MKRAHYHFVVKAIRAVLTESTSAQWAQNLREAAKRPIVSARPSPLFWFTTSEILTKPMPGGKKTVPLYLQEPECVQAYLRFTGRRQVFKPGRLSQALP